MIFKIALAQTTVPDGRMFALDQQTLVSVGILLLNFCILAVVLSLLLYKPVQNYMRKRTERISAQVQDAQDQMAQAQTLKAEYEEKLRDIAAERAATLESARLESAERHRQMLEEARLEAAAIKQRAEESIRAQREQLRQETRLHIVEVSSLMTEKLLQKAMDSETQERLFEQALAEVEEAIWPN